MIKIIDERTDKLAESLALLWEGSVRKTHKFLEEKHINIQYPIVKEALLHIEKLAVLEKDGEIVGFIGTKNQKIEMLFIDENHFKKGYGKQLIDYGIKNLGVSEVRVDEANVQARAFYEHLGFQLFAKDEISIYGMSFPILDMKL